LCRRYVSMILPFFLPRTRTHISPFPSPQMSHSPPNRFLPPVSRFLSTALRPAFCLSVPASDFRRPSSVLALALAAHPYSYSASLAPTILATAAVDFI
jgi:hypothetical protein